MLHSRLRAVTIHATQNVLVKDNVAFNITGHCYFLEDGRDDAQPGALVIGRHYVTERDSAPVQYNGIL